MNNVFQKISNFFDTVDYDDLSPKEYKQNSQDQWGENPCGSNYSSAEEMTKEYFDEIEEHRFETHPWIKDFINSFDIEDKDVLEIGVGMGTDHLELARQGANMHGIDLADQNIEITRKRFDLYGYESELEQGDAENLPFSDSRFDFVYSNGVIHHAPDTRQVVDEIHRVLRPGGQCWTTVYNKHSVYFLWTVFLCQYVLKGGFKERSLKQQVGLVEYPNNNPYRPAKVYTRNQFVELFGQYNNVETRVRKLTPADIYFFNDILRKLGRDPQKPMFPLNHFGKIFGWFLGVYATK